MIVARRMTRDEGTTRFSLKADTADSAEPPVPLCAEFRASRGVSALDMVPGTLPERPSDIERRYHREGWCYLAPTRCLPGHNKRRPLADPQPWAQ